MTKRFIFHYDVYAQYNEKYLANTLKAEDVVEEVLWAPKRIYDDGSTDKLPETQLLKCDYNGKPHLIPAIYNDENGVLCQTIDAMPIQLQEYQEKWAFSGKTYSYIPEFYSVKLKREQLFPFHEFVDSVFCPYDHSSPVDYLLVKLIALTAYSRRINVRMCSAPAMGKNSVLDPFAKLRCDSVLFQPGSLPALYIRMNNRIMGLNEICGVKKEVRDVLVRFLEDAGDGSAFFERDKIDMKYGKSRYDIHNMSVVLFYNRVCDLEEGTDKKEAFFDYVFPAKIRNRFMPFIFDGCLLERFQKPLDAAQEYEDNKNDIVALQRTLGYYQENLHKHMHDYTRHGYFNGSRLTRWADTFDSILHTIDAYANTQEEFSKLEYILYNRHECYMRAMDDMPRMQDKNEKLEVDIDYGFKYDIPKKTPVVKDTPLKPLSPSFTADEYL